MSLFIVSCRLRAEPAGTSEAVEQRRWKLV
jgi:hypothetical protein